MYVCFTVAILFPTLSANQYKLNSCLDLTNIVLLSSGRRPSLRDKSLPLTRTKDFTLDNVSLVKVTSFNWKEIPPLARITLSNKLVYFFIICLMLNSCWAIVTIIVIPIKLVTHVIQWAVYTKFPLFGKLLSIPYPYQQLVMILLNYIKFYLTLLISVKFHWITTILM